MLIGFVENTLGQSDIFNSQPLYRDKAIAAIKGGRVLPIDEIERAYMEVKQLSDSVVRESLKALSDGRIQLILTDNNPELQVLNILPFITIKTKAGNVTYIFMDAYTQLKRDNVKVVNPANFRDLLTGAMISNSYRNNPNVILNNAELKKLLMQTYTALFLRVLGREFQIMPDKPLVDTIRYWVNRYFLEKIFGSGDSPETIEILAKSDIKHLDQYMYNDIKQKYDNANIDNDKALMMLIRDANPRLGALDLEFFARKWMNLYYPPTLFAVDTLEYLIFMVMSLLNGNNSISSINAAGIVREIKNINNIRTELNKIIQ